jgi:hypothetical protein
MTTWAATTCLIEKGLFKCESVSVPFDQEVGRVQGSPSGPLLLSLLVNNIFEALQLGKIVCYSDDSYLVFEIDF